MSKGKAMAIFCPVDWLVECPWEIFHVVRNWASIHICEISYITTALIEEMQVDGRYIRASLSHSHEFPFLAKNPRSQNMNGENDTLFAFCTTTKCGLKPPDLIVALVVGYPFNPQLLINGHFPEDGYHYSVLK